MARFAARSATRRPSLPRCSRWPACRPRRSTSSLLGRGQGRGLAERLRRSVRVTTRRRSSWIRSSASATRDWPTCPRTGPTRRTPRSTSRRRSATSTSMTERERYTTRGGFYRLTGDYRQCVKEYGDLLQAYPADVAARNNLAICLANLRDFSKAFDQLRKVVVIVPNRAMYRVNLASFANFSSDFRDRRGRGEKGREAGRQRADGAGVCPGRPGPDRHKPQPPTSRSEDQRLRRIARDLGLGDLASVEGRFSEAARILEQGAAQDLSSSVRTGPPRSSRLWPTRSYGGDSLARQSPPASRR